MVSSSSGFPRRPVMVLAPVKRPEYVVAPYSADASVSSTSRPRTVPETVNEVEPRRLLTCPVPPTSSPACVKVASKRTVPSLAVPSHRPAMDGEAGAATSSLPHPMDAAMMITHAALLQDHLQPTALMPPQGGK